MDSWSLITLAAVGGMGVLAFLRVVANEVALQNRIIEMRLERECEERRRQRKRRAAEVSQETPAEDAPDASAVPTVSAVEDAA